MDKRSLRQPTPEQKATYLQIYCKQYAQIFAELMEEMTREAEASPRADDHTLRQNLLEAIQALPEPVLQKLKSEFADPEREAINARRHAARRRIEGDSST